MRLLDTFYLNINIATMKIRGEDAIFRVTLLKAIAAQRCVSGTRSFS